MAKRIKNPVDAILRELHEFKKAGRKPQESDEGIQLVTCYVCRRRMPKRDAQYLGRDTYRHQEEFPGSPMWVFHMRQRKKAERSKFFHLFAEGGARV